MLRMFLALHVFVLKPPNEIRHLRWKNTGTRLTLSRTQTVFIFLLQPMSQIIET